MPGPSRDYKRSAGRLPVLTKGFPHAKYGAAGPAVSLLTGKIYAAPKRRDLDPPPPPEPKPMEFTARALHVMVVLDSEAVAMIPAPTGKSVTLNIDVARRKLRAEITSRTMRKVIAAIAERGPEGVLIMLRGVLEDDQIIHAFMEAEPRQPKPAAQDAA